MQKQQNKDKSYWLYPLGDAAVVVQFGEKIDPATLNKVRNLTWHLQQHPFEGMIEFVPAFTTVTIYYDPWILSEKGLQDPYDKITNMLLAILSRSKKAIAVLKPRLIEIPVCYGGSFGPDLEFVSAYNNLTPEKVIEAHTGCKYQVYMIGFAPGFPYLGGMNKKIATPRKETPRSQIPAGSVGIAGTQTGIYPIQTPGGWQLIGRTPLQLFDPGREQPALLQAGDMVRFVSITEQEYYERKEAANGH